MPANATEPSRPWYRRLSQAPQPTPYEHELEAMGFVQPIVRRAARDADSLQRAIELAVHRTHLAGLPPAHPDGGAYRADAGPDMWTVAEDEEEEEDEDKEASGGEGAGGGGGANGADPTLAPPGTCAICDAKRPETETMTRAHSRPGHDVARTRSRGTGPHLQVPGSARRASDVPVPVPVVKHAFVYEGPHRRSEEGHGEDKGRRASSAEVSDHPHEHSRRGSLLAFMRRASGA